ncbi:hypothetical protein CLV78_10785 [Aliiruegeria haliotis]|uniref:Uncharacterized protein n=1 Tax=Aliiruegeria haliotis TaxID=1280846 RepID=A0A2T0RM02_9RHOB|nr:hypothetical protein [Aliiruegeria haliotis]PRY22161.1 hypothetical protein CLV78_10785 [Aliiruegeria haliotis]
MSKQSRSYDPSKEKDEDKDFLGAEGSVSQQGRSGGRLPRDIGTRDELKRANERPAGKTRVLRSDEEEDQ